MKVIIAIAEKGGVGKTTLACIVAAGLAKAGLRVLLLGLDVQVSSAAVFLKTVPATSGSAALLLGQQPEPMPGHLGVQVLTGGPALDGGDIRTRHPDELRFMLEPYRSRFDAVVIDVAPVMQHLHQLALEAADMALVVTDAQSTESITGLGKVMREIQVAQSRGRHVPQLTIPVVNKVNRRLALDTQLANSVRHKYGPQYTVVELPATTVLPRAIARKRPEAALSDESPAREALIQLVAAARSLAAPVAGASHV